MMPGVIPLYLKPSGALSTRRLIDFPLVKGADADRTRGHSAVAVGAPFAAAAEFASPRQRRHRCPLLRGTDCESDWQQDEPRDLKVS
jgi:hypothetical protein